MLKPIRPAMVLTVVALALTVACTGYTFAADPEQSVPQGEDPPGDDNGAGTVRPPAGQDGVIPPPDIGDEGIHTEVPNPGAGHEEEVIPPPGTEQNAPDTVPR